MTADDVSASGAIGVLLFLGLVWMWITLILVASTMKVGWPAMLFNLVVIVFSPLWILMTVLLIITYDTISASVKTNWHTMLDVHGKACKSCGAKLRPGPFRRLGLLIAVALSAVGPGRLLALLVLYLLRITLGAVGPSECVHCGHLDQD